MKKICVCFLSLVLLALCVGAASETDLDYVGTWILETKTFNGGYTLCAFHLTEKHTAFYVYQSFVPGYNGYHYQYTGTWEKQKTGVSIEVGQEYVMKYRATVEPDGSLRVWVNGASFMDSETYRPLATWGIKAETRDITDPLDDSLDNGSVLPYGIHRVGLQIKPGVYVMSAGESVYVKVQIHHADDKGDEVFALSRLDDDKSLKVVELYNNDFIAVGLDGVSIAYLRDYMP